MNLQTKDSAATGIGRGCCRAARFAGTMACGLGLLVAVHHDVSPAFAQQQIEAGPRIAGATIALDTKAVPVPRAAASSRMPPSAVEHRIRLTGIIRPGDADRLREVLAGFRMPATAVPGRSLATIELSSLGGNLVEGLKIGYLLKEFGVVAVVRSGDACLSACALAFLGGNDRNAPSVPSDRCNLEIGGKVAFHNFWLNTNGLREVTSDDPVASRLQGFNDARGGAARLIGFAAEMGVPVKFVGYLMGRPAEELEYVRTVEQFLSLHVCPIGLGRPSISWPQQANNVCSHSTGWLDPASPLHVTELPARDAKRYLLERVQSHMQSAGTKGRLAAQLASAAVMRVDDEIDRLYDDLRAAGVALPDIVGPTFEIGRYRSGTYEPLCYVSLSVEHPDKFSVVVQTPKSLSQPPYLPPDNCRRLFLFHRNAVINLIS